MDLYSTYNKQLEYYEYVEKQRENYTDLTSGLSNPNESVVIFAKILFNKSKKNIDQDLSGILIEESMEVADVFCMLLELVLYGLDILTNSEREIHSIRDFTEEILDEINMYIKSIGFKMEFKEDFIDGELCLYRDRTDYYCEILQKPPFFLCYAGWYVLNYRLLVNKNFVYNSTTPLRFFKALLLNGQKIFTINFKYLNEK